MSERPKRPRWSRMGPRLRREKEYGRARGFIVKIHDNPGWEFKCRRCGHEFCLSIVGKGAIKILCPNPMCSNETTVKGRE